MVDIVERVSQSPPGLGVGEDDEHAAFETTKTDAVMRVTGFSMKVLCGVASKAGSNVEG
jgi:hypothetical protein